MKKKAIFSLVLVAVLSPLLVLGCRSRTDRSAGPVALSLGDFLNYPSSFSAKAAVQAGQVTVGTIVIRSIPKDPNFTASSLQDVEIDSYQVTYRRRDTGTRIPPPLVAGVFLSVPFNSQGTLNNLAIFKLDQLLNPPISDLAQFGVDQETGSAVIVLDATLQFFGHTISGDSVATAPVTITIDVTP